MSIHIVGGPDTGPVADAIRVFYADPLVEPVRWELSQDVIDAIAASYGIDHVSTSSARLMGIPMDKVEGSGVMRLRGKPRPVGVVAADSACGCGCEYC